MTTTATFRLSLFASTPAQTLVEIRTYFAQLPAEATPTDADREVVAEAIVDLDRELAQRRAR